MHTNVTYNAELSYCTSLTLSQVPVTIRTRKYHAHILKYYRQQNKRVFLE